MDLFTPGHIILVLIGALLIFGPKRLPDIGKSLGKGIREFKGALNSMTGDEPETPAAPVPPAPAAPPAPGPVDSAPAPAAPTPVFPTPATAVPTPGVPTPVDAPPAPPATPSA
jgi:TatA/E family protein of Tat protein translocase